MKNRAIEDPEVRAAIWATVCLAAEQLHSCAVLLPSVKKAKPQEISINSPVPSFKTWRLVEALSLLGILLRADSVQTKAVKLFARTGPVEFVEDGEPRFLWVQQGAEAELSGLIGRPDLFVTSTAEHPTVGNIVRVVEVKFVKSFGAADLRAEFGRDTICVSAAISFGPTTLRAPRWRPGPLGYGSTSRDLGSIQTGNRT